MQPARKNGLLQVRECNGDKLLNDTVKPFFFIPFFIKTNTRRPIFKFLFYGIRDANAGHIAVSCTDCYVTTFVLKSVGVKIPSINASRIIRAFCIGQKILELAITDGYAVIVLFDLLS